MSIRDMVRLVAACAVSLSAGWVGSLAPAEGTFTSWYVTIEKPVFTPPGWVFGPVWAILYILMGIAAFLVGPRGLGAGSVRIALVWLVVQLGRNALWPVVFFAWRRIDLALAVVILLWLAVVVTAYYFHRLWRPAGLLLVPYLL
ncbi:MAG: tryptophan-rich sensory protein [Planctomycetes bacterium]|nr:tryptophan-rich sensory protein [Planctomycetota bacterium]